MNLGLVKLVLWIGALGLLGGLAFTLYEYKTTKGERKDKWITEEIQRDSLKQEPREVSELPELPYDPVKGMFYALNWTGVIPPPPPPPDETQEPNTVKPLLEPVDRLVEVLFIQQDTSAAERSLAMVKYVGKLTSHQAKEKIDGHILQVGDTLPIKYDYWELIEIDAAKGLTFHCTTPDAFDRAPEDEVIAPPEPISGDIPVLGADGVLVDVDRTGIPEATAEQIRNFTDSWTEETYQVRPGHTRVGTRDAATIETDYLDILSKEVRHRSWRNPKTNQYEGIEILEIAPGSIAGTFGVRTGDVIKSINGHDVSSVNEAITFAKNNSEYYSVWEVVVENAGQERTVTVETPPDAGE
jgi:hypothetical protein